MKKQILGTVLLAALAIAACNDAPKETVTETVATDTTTATTMPVEAGVMVGGANMVPSCLLYTSRCV